MTEPHKPKDGIGSLRSAGNHPEHRYDVRPHDQFVSEGRPTSEADIQQTADDRLRARKLRVLRSGNWTDWPTKAEQNGWRN
jgi:hypothetical protein